jgi:DNA mismatch endonuclease, patch repair protein
MQVLRRRDTTPELALRSALHGAGLRFRVDYRVPGTRRRADIAFTARRVAVFVDGCFWHGCPQHLAWPKHNSAWWRSKIEENRARDRDSDSQLEELGWTVIRFWEHSDASACADELVEFLRSRT